MAISILTEEQKELIRFTWRELESDMSNVGTMVFLGIFNRSPEVRALFPFKDVYGEDLIHHAIFRNHSYRLGEFLYTAV